MQIYLRFAELFPNRDATYFDPFFSEGCLRKYW